MAAFAIITDNGIVLDVASDSRLTYEFVATTFNDDTIMKGSYSYPVVFPFTEKNDKALGYGRFLENRLGRKPIDVNIYLLGMSWKRGQLQYDVTDKGYEGVIIVDNSLVADPMRERSIASVFTVMDKNKFVSHKSVRIGYEPELINNEIQTINNNVGQYPFCLPTYVNPLVKSEVPELIDGIVNDFSNGYAIGPNQLLGAFFYLTWVIKEVCTFLGFKAMGSFLDDPFIKSLVIDNNGVRAGSDVLSTGLINPAQHLPGISIADFFKALRNDHKVFIYFDSANRIVHFDKSNKVLSSNNRLDITGIQVAAKPTIKRQSVTCYKLKTKTDDTDELYSQVQYESSVVVGYSDSSKDVEMSIGRPFMNVFPFWGFDVRLPYKRQVSNMYGDDYKIEKERYNADNEYGKNTFGFRLLSYKGSYSFGGTVWIAEATSDDIGNGNRVFENSLALGGEKGMVSRYSLPWYSFFCLSEEVEVTAKFSVIDFLRVSPLQKLFITDENRTKVDAIMDKVRFEPTESGVIDAKVFCYPHYDINAVAKGFRVVVNEPETIVPDGKLYVKLYNGYRHTTVNQPGGGIWYTLCDIWLEFYEDANCTVRARAVNNIEFTVRRSDQQYTYPGIMGPEVGSANLGTFVASTWNFKLLDQVYHSWNKYMNTGHFNVNALYFLKDPTGGQKFEVAKYLFGDENPEFQREYFET